MSYLLSPSLVAKQMDVDQNPWVRGVTRGSPFMIPSENRASLAQNVIQITTKAKEKTREWMQEAIHTGTNISKIQEALQWTINDMAEVAMQPGQFALVNLEREKTVWQLQCCNIIRKVTKNVMMTAQKMAAERINPLNTFQREELNRIGSDFIRRYKDSKKMPSQNIQAEEIKSLNLRKKYLEQVSQLLSNPDRYQAISIRESAKMRVELTHREVKDLNPELNQSCHEIDQAKFQALQALDELELMPPDEMNRCCESIVLQVDRVAAGIFLTANLHIRWMSRSCSTETL